MKILIVKTSSLGDIIHAFPALSYLRQQFPEAQIDWVVEKPFAELVLGHPAINTVYTIDTKLWRQSLAAFRQTGEFFKRVRQTHYDVVFDLQGNMKSGVITACSRAKDKVGYGRKQVSEWPNMLFTNTRYNPPVGCNVREENLFLVKSYFHDEQPFEDTGVLLRISDQEKEKIRHLLAREKLGRPIVMVCPGSAWPNKQMNEEALCTFLKKVQEHLHCSFLLVWGSEKEKSIAENLHRHFPDQSIIVDRMPLPVLQNLMGEIDLVIAMDSLPLHLAGTTGTPTFSVFGASSAAKYKPRGKQHQTFQGPCPYGRTFERRCPILRTCKTGACIRHLTGLEVFQSFIK